MQRGVEGLKLEKEEVELGLGRKGSWDQVGFRTQRS